MTNVVIVIIITIALMVMLDDVDNVTSALGMSLFLVGCVT